MQGLEEVLKVWAWAFYDLRFAVLEFRLQGQCWPGMSSVVSAIGLETASASAQISCEFLGH